MNVYVTEDGTDAGRTAHGKHANRNKGVSLIRAGRELLIDDDWCNDPRDRWWGIEVIFHPCTMNFLVSAKISKVLAIIKRLLTQ